MSGGAQDQAVRTGRIARTFIYVVLIYFALFYLLPLFIMAINSLKPLSEITGEFRSDELLGRIFGSFCIGK